MEKKRVNIGLRLPIKTHMELTQMAEELGVSKNDFILLALREKLDREKNRWNSCDEERK